MAETDHTTMVNVLKNSCVPVLREAGFKGSFPDFYRETQGFVAVINFQFFSSGGSFCINLSYADPGRANIYFQPETEVPKLRVSQTRDRTRLGAPAQGGDRWYSFGRTTYGEFRGEPIEVHELVDTINTLFRSEAEAWWESKQRKEETC